MVGILQIRPVLAPIVGDIKFRIKLWSDKVWVAENIISWDWKCQLHQHFLLSSVLLGIYIGSVISNDRYLGN